MPGTITFVAPGLPVGEGEIPLVRLERDLLTLTTPELTADDLAWVRRRSHEITEAVGSALPAKLWWLWPDPDLPDFWPAFREAFRTYSAAPQAANELLATKALETTEPDHIVVRENVNRDWLSFQGTILEAVKQANDEHGGLADVMAHPGWGMRAVREVAIQFRMSGPSVGLSLTPWRRVRAGWPSAPAEPGSVVCLTLGPTTVGLAEKLRAELAGSAGLPTTALVLDPADWTHAVRDFAGPCVAPHHFVHPDSVRAMAYHRASGMLRGWDRTARRLRLRETIGRRALVAMRRRLYLAIGLDLARVTVAMQQAERLMDRLQPSAVVSFHLYGHMLAPFVLEAKARGIPVIYVQHGVYLAKDRCLEPMEYDLNCVFGPASAEMFAGRPGETVVVGQPQYAAPEGRIDRSDAARPPSYSAPPGGLEGRIDRSDAVRPPSYSAPPDGAPSILVATQPRRPEDEDGGQADRWLYGVVDAAERLGARAVIKPHPAETDISEYEALAREHSECVELLRADAASITDLLPTSAMLVTKDSTVVFDAAMAGVPAITINLSGRRDRFPFAEDGGAVGVYRYEDIQPALERLLRDPAAREALAATREAFLDRHIGCRDGKAIEMIAERIAGIVTRRAQ